MQAETVSFLLDLNRQFYQTFGEAFAATRRRIQPGIQRALETIPLRGRWLDLGCGSGALAARWARDNRKGLYLGLDFSPVLLQEARAALPDPLPAGLDIQFLPADLSHPHWPQGLPAGSFDGVLAFAVLHHLPSRQLQARVLSQVRALLSPGQRFIFSVWQFQRSPKLMTRVQPWSTLPQLDPSDLEPGDTLLDWRCSVPGQPEQSGLRYVHLFTPESLASLTAEAGFALVQSFDSDGHTGNLSSYQICKAV